LTNRRQSKVLRASEIGSYAYCARGWWLNRVLGYASAHKEMMALGEREHRGHGREVVVYHRLRRLGYLMLALASLLALSILFWWLASTLTP
jgi:hypothetical protein